MSRRIRRSPSALGSNLARIVSGTSMSIPQNPNSPPAAGAAAMPALSLLGARLRKHADYQRVYAATRKRQSPTMSWFLAPQSEPADGPRVGLTAGKVLGKAHDRNRIKRRLREVLRRHVDLLPRGFDLILHPRQAVLTIEFTKLDAEVVRILMQARVQAKIEAASGIQPATAKPVL
jgi:ribonuclease P protein component